MPLEHNAPGHPFAKSLIFKQFSISPFGSRFA
jgi:hypothetical protein